MVKYILVVCMGLSNTLVGQSGLLPPPWRQKTYGWTPIALKMGDTIKDVFEIARYSLSWDSLKVLAIAAPVYGISRKYDKKIHAHFYDKKHHKNIHQLPRSCYQCARVGLAVPFIIAGSMAFFASDYEMRTTGTVFLLGLPITWGIKRGIKTIKCSGNLRPLSACFPPMCCYGGMPSGHMLEMAYITTIFGIRYGPLWSIPLTLFTGFMGAEFIVCNRHYLSQLVLGATLGVIFGLAADKLITTKLTNSQLCLTHDTAGCPAFEFSYNF